TRRLAGRSKVAIRDRSWTRSSRPGVVSEYGRDSRRILDPEACGSTYGRAGVGSQKHGAPPFSNDGPPSGPAGADLALEARSCAGSSPRGRSRGSAPTWGGKVTKTDQRPARCQSRAELFR